MMVNSYQSTRRYNPEDSPAIFIVTAVESSSQNDPTSEWKIKAMHNYQSVKEWKQDPVPLCSGTFSNVTVY
jgi:hypothetical protein